MKLSQVAIQLYTLRDFCKTAPDFAAAMKKVREIGYTAVQISGVGPIPEAEIVAICKAEGLTICATHESPKSILDEPQKVIDRLKALGCQLTAYPWPEGVDFKSVEQLEALAFKLDASGAKLRAAGLTLAYHNHDKEFLTIGNEVWLDAVLRRTKPENVAAELDTYWVKRGGADVLEWVRKLRGRLPFMHLKDYNVVPGGEPYFCEIGAGILPFKEIIAEAEAGGCEWFIVEQDSCPGDPFVSISQSFDYIKANLVA